MATRSITPERSSTTSTTQNPQTAGLLSSLSAPVVSSCVCLPTKKQKSEKKQDEEVKTRRSDVKTHLF